MFVTPLPPQDYNPFRFRDGEHTPLSLDKFGRAPTPGHIGQYVARHVNKCLQENEQHKVTQAKLAMTATQLQASLETAKQSLLEVEAEVENSSKRAKPEVNRLQDEIDQLTHRLAVQTLERQLLEARYNLSLCLL